jgi:potassium channel subfamily K protein 1
VFYILFGVPLSFLVFYNVAERIEARLNSVGVRVDENQTAAEPTAGRVYLKFACAAFLFILLIYVLPSVFFSYLMEYPSWSFLDAVYFCYISISTVGFGDFIPGRGLSTLARNNYRLAMTGNCNWIMN